MPKPKNLLATRNIKVSANPVVEHYLEQLVLKGAYGNNTTEAAGILLNREIQRLLEVGVLVSPPSDVVDRARK